MGQYLESAIIDNICWVCGSNNLELAKKSNINKELTSSDFRITDKLYGITAEIHHCRDCDFLQCSDMKEILTFYENLEDSAYEEGRSQRSIQAKKILDILLRFKSTGKLLDIGAGSGILVEQAIIKNYDAEGIEPSNWLQNTAKNLQIPVHLGTFPNSKAVGPYDAVTIIDVLEHVPNPVGLLKEVRKILSKEGVGMVSTPDVKSLIARLFGWKWWHFRVAHVGYFNEDTLLKILDNAGLKTIGLFRPSWYFPADYIFDRLKNYIPLLSRFHSPNFLKKITIPLNLRDQMLVLFVKKETES